MEKLAINTFTPPPNRPRGEVVAQEVSAQRQENTPPLVSLPAPTAPVAASSAPASAAQAPLEAQLNERENLLAEVQAGADSASVAQEKVELAANVKKLNDAVAIAQRSIQFDVHEETGRTIITVSDKETGEKIRTIPPETLLRVAEHIEEILADKTDALRGLLINQEV
ncbi:hypothetical protein A9Q90_00655 [Gammaproteobacteria bacterium 54_18_T64]|nr:hypothetical protein A9Q90_00655 [Gammaproteobacteria bacterium 54_18_T64]